MVYHEKRFIRCPAMAKQRTDFGRKRESQHKQIGSQERDDGYNAVELGYNAVELSCISLSIIMRIVKRGLEKEEMAVTGPWVTA